MSEPPTLTNVRVQCLTGTVYEVQTPLSFILFFKMVCADGFMTLTGPGIPAQIVPFHAIACFVEISSAVAALMMATPGGQA